MKLFQHTGRRKICSNAKSAGLRWEERPLLDVNIFAKYLFRISEPAYNPPG